MSTDDPVSLGARVTIKAIDIPTKVHVSLMPMRLSAC